MKIANRLSGRVGDTELWQMNKYEIWPALPHNDDLYSELKSMHYDARREIKEIKSFWIKNCVTFSNLIQTP